MLNGYGEGKLMEIEVVIFTCTKCGFIAMYNVRDIKYKPLKDTPEHVCPMCSKFSGWKRVDTPTKDAL